MTTEKQPAGQLNEPIERKLVLVTGVILGAIAGIVSLFGQQTFDWAIPGGMMIASWVAINRAARKRFWAGFYASLLAGVLGWAIYLVQLASHGMSLKDAAVFTGVFLLPFVAIVSLFGSWVFGRTRDRVVAAKSERELKEKAEEERRKEMYRKRPKRKYKKKKK